MKRERIEILFFEGCPHAELAIDRAREAAGMRDEPPEIQLVEVVSEADAIERRFLGSPTVRVDGVDVDPGAVERTDFGLQCRVYSVDGVLEGAPPVAWIDRALG